MRRKRLVKKEPVNSIDQNIHFITYGNVVYERAKKRICDEAKNFCNFSSISDYGPENLDAEFKEKFKHILSQSKGGGYWIWKPYIIYKKLQEIKEGEYLLYMDAGCTFNNSGFPRFREYISMLENSDTPLLSFQMNHLPEKHYTTDKVFEHFGITFNSKIKNTGQIVGGIQFIRKCEYTKNIIKKWLDTLYQDSNLFTNYYKCTREDFRDNRHDQSIFSVIRKLYGSVYLEDETYFLKFGKYESLKYPFWATRKS